MQEYDYDLQSVQAARGGGGAGPGPGPPNTKNTTAYKKIKLTLYIIPFLTFFTLGLAKNHDSTTN